MQDKLAQLFGFGGRKPGGRLVEQEKARIDGERPREPNPAFFAVAQPGRWPMRLIGEVKLAENSAARRRASVRESPCPT